MEIGARFLDRWGHGRSPVRAPAWTEIREREEAAGPFYGTLIPFGRDQFFFPLLFSLSLLFLNERTVSVTPSCSKRKIRSLRDSLLLASPSFLHPSFAEFRYF